ncbi:MAG: sugar phosphate isomerase/epimerase family protein [Erysipelotrichaceae bacterium]|nr:sugar phosphate isomerase/epimerase family protein [Erysipelotrichaceae bacterium]
MKNLYIIPDMANIEESCRLADEYNLAFEYNDFFKPAVLKDDELIKEKIAFYKNLKRDRSSDTLHGAFYDITIHSDDPDIYEISKKRIVKCMEIAKELGVKGVIFHTNFIANFKEDFYKRGWLIKNEQFFRELANKYQDIDIYMENMFDDEADLLAELAKQLSDLKNFGVCFDVAHERVFGIKDFKEQLKPYTRHMHINDNNGLSDQHKPVGEGIVDWKAYSDFASEVKPSVLIEVTSIEGQKKSIEFLKNNHLYPFNR